MNYRSNAVILAEDDERLENEMAARADAILINDAHIHVPNPHRDAGMFAHRGVMDHASDLARGRGEKPSGAAVTLWDGEIKAASRGTGTDNLPGLLANVASKAALLGWNAAETSYQHWTNRGSTPTFHQASRVALDSTPQLAKVSGTREIPLATRFDRREFMQIATYAMRFPISREAVLGDDSAAFAREALEYGRAGRRTVQQVVSDLLTTGSGVGPTLNQDSLALFHATHGNYVSSSGGPPSVSTLDAARKAMRTRTDPTSGAVLNLGPRFLLVPAALESVARVLVYSQNSAVGDDEGDLRVLVDPILDGKTNGATAWYLIAGRADTFEVAFLGGRDAPIVEEMTTWERDGVEARVRLDFGVTCRDFRTMFRNIGV